MNADEKEVLYGFLCDTNNMNALMKLLNGFTEEYKRKITSCPPTESELIAHRYRWEGAAQIVTDLYRNVNHVKGENK